MGRVTNMAKTSASKSQQRKYGTKTSIKKYEKERKQYKKDMAAVESAGGVRKVTNIKAKKAKSCSFFTALFQRWFQAATPDSAPKSMQLDLCTGREIDTDTWEDTLDLYEYDDHP